MDILLAATIIFVAYSVFRFIYTENIRRFFDE